MDRAVEDDGLPAALVQVSFTVIGVVSAVAARRDLSLTLVRVTDTLRGRMLTMSELATHLGVDRSTVTGLVTRAEDRGLLARVENEADRRSSRVALTDQGQELAALCAAEVAREVEALVASLSTRERRSLDRLLRATSRVEGRRERVADRQARRSAR